MAKMSECKCGCGEMVKGQFKQGHDVRYKADVVANAWGGFHTFWMQEAVRLNLTHKLGPYAQRRIAIWNRPRDARGRFVSVTHIEAVAAWHNDEDGFTHAHLDCVAAAAIVSITQHQDGFACSTCIEVTPVSTPILRHLERAAEAARQRAVREGARFVDDAPVYEFQGLNLVEVA